jgi:hypothetical protein
MDNSRFVCLQTYDPYVDNPCNMRPRNAQGLIIFVGSGLTGGGGASARVPVHRNPDVDERGGFSGGSMALAFFTGNDPLEKARTDPAPTDLAGGQTTPRLSLRSTIMRLCPAEISSSSPTGNRPETWSDPLFSLLSKLIIADQ